MTRSNAIALLVRTAPDPWAGHSQNSRWVAWTRQECQVLETRSRQPLRVLGLPQLFQVYTQVFTGDFTPPAAGEKVVTVEVLLLPAFIGSLS